METRVSLQPAYVLHRRPFQDSSLLIDFFTLDYGRVRAVCKGARRQKSRVRPLLQLFQPLLVSLSGRGEVKTVAGVETGMAPISLRGERLFSGLYVNELLTRLLHNQEEHTALYRSYQQTLLGLQGDQPMEWLLRRFELNLLTDLGYGINLAQDCFTEQPIESECSYRFLPDVGFQAVHGEANTGSNERCFLGAHLIALRNLDLEDPQSAKAAKRLLRLALTAHLGDKPLASRSLFLSRA